MFLSDLIRSVDDYSAPISDDLGSVLLEVIKHSILSVEVLLRTSTHIQVRVNFVLQSVGRS